MKHKTKTILIAVRNSKEVAADAIRACKRAQRNQLVEEPINRLYFTDENTLFKTLSTKRRQLLRFLHHGRNSVSIKQLAEKLCRDYKNVHSDIKLLAKLGLVELDNNKKVFVPWDNIALEISLAA